MIRATTPKQSFIFKQDPELFVKILITYAQGAEIVLEKTKDDLTFEHKVDETSGEESWCAWFRMTQEEANLFQALSTKKVYVQVRALTSDNEALASAMKLIFIHDVLNDEVLTP